MKMTKKHIKNNLETIGSSLNNLRDKHITFASFVYNGRIVNPFVSIYGRPLYINEIEDYMVNGYKGKDEVIIDFIKDTELIILRNRMLDIIVQFTNFTLSVMWTYAKHLSEKTGLEYMIKRNGEELTIHSDNGEIKFEYLETMAKIKSILINDLQPLMLNEWEIEELTNSLWEVIDG